MSNPIPTKCMDLDQDGYGQAGPTASWQGTSGGAITAGTQTVSVSATTNTFTASTTSGSNQIIFLGGTNVFSGSYDFQVGMTITGTGIPNGTVIQSPTVLNSQLQISNNATATGTATFTVGLVAGSTVTYDTAQNMEKITLTGVGSGTITGVFSLSHASGVLMKTMGCVGIDADDQDPTVRTGAEMLTKWGSVSAFMAHRGQELKYKNPIPGDSGSAAAIANSYASPHAVWYVAPSPAVAPNTVTGSDSNSCHTAALPCLTWGGLQSKGLASGDMVIGRQAWGNAGGSSIVPPAGTSSAYTIVVSYPGERMIFANGPPSVFNIVVSGSNSFGYAVFDQMTFISGSYITGGTLAGVGSVHTFNCLFIGIDGNNNGASTSSINMFNGMTNMTIMESVMHDNDCSGGGCQHGVYWGSDDVGSSNIIYRRNIAYGNDFNGFTFNGRCTNCTFDQLESYSNGISGGTWEMGVSNSTVTNSLFFSNGTNQFVLYNYRICSGPGDNICPYDQTFNVFENNVFYGTGNANVANNPNSIQSCPSGIDFCEQGSFTFNNATSPVTGSFANNTFRNNIFVSYGYVNHYGPVVFESSAGCGVGSGCISWVTSSVFNNNDFWQSDGNAGTATIAFGNSATFGPQPYTCAQAVSQVSQMTGCLNIDPKFITAGLSQWNLENQFNFNLQSTSTLIHNGTSVGVSSYDLAGDGYFSNPTIGAIEPNTPYWTNFTSGTTIQNDATEPNNSVCNDSGNASTPYTQSCDCTPSPYLYTGLGNRLISAWGGGWGRTKAGFEEMGIIGGGHSDGVDDRLVMANMAGFANTLGITRNSSYVNKSVTCAVSSYINIANSPRARHIYDTAVYDPNIDKVIVYGGGTGWGGDNFGDTWILDVSPMPGSAPTWTAADPTACSGCSGAVGQPMLFFAGGSAVHGSPDNYGAYDPNSKTEFYFINHNQFSQYVPSTNTWINASDANGLFGGYCGTSVDCLASFIDSVNQKFWLIGDGSAAYFDISTAALAAMATGTKLPFTNASLSMDSSCFTFMGVGGAGGAGIQYVPGLGLAVAYLEQTGGQVIYFNPATLKCTTITAGGSTPANGGNQNGLYGRWQCFPTLGTTTNPVCLEVNDWNVEPAYLGPITPCSISPSTLPNGTLGVSYGTQTLTAVGCGSGPFTWSVFSGGFPTGISLAAGCTGATCSISGTPAQSGTFSVTIEVTDGGSNTATQPYSLVILPGTSGIKMPTAIK